MNFLRVAKIIITIKYHLVMLNYDSFLYYQMKLMLNYNSIISVKLINEYSHVSSLFLYFIFVKMNKIKHSTLPPLP